jgi:hydrocephalus-inducing protein
MKVVKFGALRVGQTVKKIVPIVNNSPASITFHLGMTPSTLALQDKTTMKLSPLNEITLAPKGGTAKVELVFSPKCRIPQFTEEVFINSPLDFLVYYCSESQVLLECAGLFQPLFVVSGSCQGTEIQLDATSIPFGAVVQKSSSSRKLIMSNTGDIGARLVCSSVSVRWSSKVVYRFKWDVKKFGPDFRIVPSEGYLSPGMEVPFDITFHPVEISNDIRYDVSSIIVVLFLRSTVPALFFSEFEMHH